MPSASSATSPSTPDSEAARAWQPATGRPCSAWTKHWRGCCRARPAMPSAQTETVSHLRRPGPRAGRPRCARPSTCPAPTTARWTAMRCVPPTPPPDALLPVAQRIPAGVVGQPLAPHTAARIFTGAQIPAGCRRGADAGAGRGRAWRRPGRGACACRAGGGRLDPPSRRGRVRRRRGAGARHAPDAAGAGPGRQRRRGDAAGACAGRAWRCCPPATNWSCPASRCSRARSTTPTASCCARLLQACGCDVTDLGIVPDRLQATREALAPGGARATT